MNLVRYWTLLLLLISCISARANLRAGAAAIDITPTNLPIRTAGNLTVTVVKKVHDPLHARAIVLDDGKTKLAIAVVDTCMMSREDVEEAKKIASAQTGIPVTNMLVSATHTHTAPAVYGCHGNDPEPEYLAYIIPRIARSISDAASRMQRARVGWGKRDLPEFVYCRRWIMQPGTAQSPPSAFTGALTNLAMMNPGANNTNKVRQTGPVDPAVTVLSIQSREGKPLALLANYSTHYASAPVHEISADYFGEFCKMVEASAQKENPQFVALMSNGTSGDANPIDFTKTNWVATPSVVAKAVANAASEAMREISYHSDPSLKAITETLRLGVRLPNKSEVDEARDYLKTKVGDRPTRNWDENYARETTLLADWPATKEITLQTLAIGSFAIAAIPCETFGSTGLNIKKESPYSLTMVIGLANGYHGYLPPADQFPLGGYTTWRARTSYLKTNAEHKISAKLSQMLKQSKSQRN